MNYKIGWLFAIAFITIVNSQATSNKDGKTSDKAPAPQDSKLILFTHYLCFFLAFKKHFFSRKKLYGFILSRPRNGS